MRSQARSPAPPLYELEDAADKDPSRSAARAIANARVVPDENVDLRVERWDLGAGESAVLTFALGHPGFEAVLDDRAARNRAAALSIPVRGTLGMLLLAKRHGALAAVAPVISALRDAGMHLDTTRERTVLELAGEA